MRCFALDPYTMLIAESMKFLTKGKSTQCLSQPLFSHLQTQIISIFPKSLAWGPVYLQALNPWLCFIIYLIFGIPNLMIFFKGNFQKNHQIYSLCAKQSGLIFPRLLKHLGDSIKYTDKESNITEERLNSLCQWYDYRPSALCISVLFHTMRVIIIPAM